MEAKANANSKFKTVEGYLGIGGEDTAPVSTAPVSNQTANTNPYVQWNTDKLPGMNM